MNACKDVLHVMSPCTKSSFIFEKRLSCSLAQPKQDNAEIDFSNIFSSMWKSKIFATRKHQLIFKNISKENENW